MPHLNDALLGGATKYLDKLLKQDVYVLKVFFKSCHVEAKLAGLDVKLKCRGSVATFAKTEPCRVPGGGGELHLFEPTFQAIYEGDEALRFELCHASRWRSSKTLARSEVPLLTVFSMISSRQEAVSWTVDFVSNAGQRMGSLEVSINYVKKRLGSRSLGLDALNVNKLPPAMGSWARAHPEAMSRRCLHVADNLTYARRTVRLAAGVQRSSSTKVALPFGVETAGMQVDDDDDWPDSSASLDSTDPTHFNIDLSALPLGGNAWGRREHVLIEI